MGLNTVRNKWCLFLFIIWPLNAISSDINGEFELTTFDQHQKLIEKHIIILDKNRIKVDGAELSLTETSIKAKYFKTLVSHRDDIRLKCASGIYQYDVKYNNQNFTEKNCLSSKRYFELSRVFDKMKKNMVLSNE